MKVFASNGGQEAQSAIQYDFAIKVSIIEIPNDVNPNADGFTESRNETIEGLIEYLQGWIGKDEILRYEVISDKQND